MDTTAKSGGRAALPGPSRWRLILGLCLFVVAAEGYDVQAMAFAAPLIATAWQVSANTIGMLLTASVAGIITGSLLLAPLGDRIGRRAGVLFGLAIAAGFTLGCAFAHTVLVLALLRAAAGLGLGMAMPNIMAVAMEAAPPSRRTLAVIVANCGYPLGAGLGGALASTLVGRGFTAIFFIGGAATLLVFLLCLAALPETWSPQSARAAAAHPGADRTNLHLLRALFTPERAKSTLLFWVLNFTGIAVVYFLVSWLPTLLSLDGLSGRTTLIATAIFNASGVIGGLSMGFAQQRFRAFAILTFAYGLAITAVFSLALGHGQAALLSASAMAGVSIAGSQFVLNAAVNQFYPPQIRVGASGFALGIGRIGALLAPICGGLVLARSHSVREAFLVTAVPATIAFAAALSLALLERAHRRRAGASGKAVTCTPRPG